MILQFLWKMSTVLHPIDEDEPDIEDGLADCIERLKE